MTKSILLYYLLSFFLLFLCAKISYYLNLIDLPNKRSFHSKITAYTGGIAISVILLCAIKIFNIKEINLNLILSVAFLISIVGFLDDKYNLNVGNKLSLQIIPIFYLVIYANLKLENIGDYNYFKLNLGAFAIPFTLLCILFLINSFNYFDGMDGILVFSSISVLSILYFLISDHNIQLFIKIIMIPTIIFLFFNFSIFKLPKLFLGDGGSLLLGFIISFLIIYIANKNLVHPILLAWSISIFVFEFLSINLIRLKNKSGLFTAGHDHLHHLLYKKNNSVFLTNLFMSLTNIILFLIGYFGFVLINPLASLILFHFLFILYLVLRYNYYENKIKIK